MDIDEVLTRGVAEILPSKDGLKKLMEGKKITLYQGFDPSMPSLHLGNLVGVMKLRQFQKLGHKIIFLIGDFTGMIGDPSDKLAVRKQLTREEVEKNYQTWVSQIKNLLDFEGENKVEIRKNSEWSDKITFKNLIQISSNFTVQQLIERDMYQQRLKRNEPIYMHEFLYPIAQGYDSVEMDVDLEIGGNDQIFNMLAGRALMRALKGKEKYVLATKLLTDKEGKKVGKTTGNALFLDSTPDNFFGGIMSFPDEAILPGFELLTEVNLEGLPEKVNANPMEEKKHLAYEIVKLIWGEKDANEAKNTFEKTFQEKAPTYDVKVDAGNNLAATIAPYTSLKSMSDAKRYINQKSVDVNGTITTDPTYKIKSGDKIKVGEKVFLQVK
jgi:tyrosyl-tRNA synthetase